MTTMRHGGGGVMLWETFLLLDQGSLLMLTRNIREAKYRTALKENRQETRKIFQVDNKLKHTARAKNKNMHVLNTKKERQQH